MDEITMSGLYESDCGEWFLVVDSAFDMVGMGEDEIYPTPDQTEVFTEAMWSLSDRTLTISN
jgi:hypothetical protein